MKFFYVSKGTDEQILSGIVMQGTPPERESDPYLDSQNDWCKMAELQKAARSFMQNERRVFDVNHEGRDYEFPVIDSYVIEQDDIMKFGVELKKGAWIMTLKIDNDEVWEKVKNGELEGFSVQGTAKTPDN
ncbi:putative protein YqbD [subsurface metagenome]